MKRSTLLSWLLLGILVFRGGPIVSGATAATWDFSPGSNDRLWETFSNGQESLYHEIVAAYASECERQSENATLALERVRFLEFFYYSEDLYFDSLEQDYKAATEYLEASFPQAPGTILWHLESEYDLEVFLTEARRHERLMRSWSAPHQAAYHLLKAQRYNWNERPASALSEAAISFGLDPQLETALLLAELQLDEGDEIGCGKTLRRVDFGEATPWQLKTKMKLLFALGETEEANTLMEQLRASNEVYIGVEEIVAARMANGDLEGARAAYDEQKLEDWNRLRWLRSRYDFELEHGDAEHVESAYRSWRAEDWFLDPYLRERWTLHQRFPEIPFRRSDWAGLAALLFLLLVAAAVPLLVLLPVDYWGLRRERAGKIQRIDGRGWTLRSVWVLTGVLCAVEVGMLWWFQPSALVAFHQDESAINGVSSVVNPVTDTWLLWGKFLSDGCIALFAVGFFLRFRDQLRVLWTEAWSVRRCFGVTLLGLIGIKLFAAIYQQMLPEPIVFPAQGSPYTLQLILALNRHFGWVGMAFELAVITPLVEEFLFRGLLLRAFSRATPFWFANFLQASLFAASHEDYRLFPFFLLFGLLAGWFTRRSGGLLAPMLFHAGNNLLAAIAYAVLWH